MRKSTAVVATIALHTLSIAEGTFTPALPQAIRIEKSLPGSACSSDGGECGDFLICNEGHCQECVADDECAAIQPEHACLPLGRTHTICAHKRLLPPDTRDWVAVLLALLLCALSAGGGIGGGGLLLPLYMIVLAFTPRRVAAHKCDRGRWRHRQSRLLCGASPPKRP